MTEWEGTHQLGGPGHIVQIDESSFTKKYKFKRGRYPKKDRWVFGIAETDGMLLIIINIS